MGRETHSVTIQRATLTGDGGGGKTSAWATVRTAQATRRYYASKSLEDLTGTGTPGTRVRRMCVFVLDLGDVPAADLVDGDRIVDAGDAYEVRFVRRYGRTVQADTERVT
jgi:hypothetical protein